MRFLGFKMASFLIQDEKGWLKCEAIGDITENFGRKEVIVATNLISVPRTDSIHSNSFPQAVSVHSDSLSQAVPIP